MTTLHAETPSLAHVNARDGVRIAVHRLGPAAAASPRVVMFPGTFSNASFWLGTRGVGLARELADAGFETWSVDPRGHGASERRRPGHRWTFDEWGRADAAAVLDTATRDGRPVIAIGHSAGGAAILAALAGEPALRDRLAAAVIVATPLPWLQPWRRGMAQAFRALAAVLPTFPARALRLGPEDEPGTVMRQWMEWNLSRRWTGDDGTDYVAALGDVRVPVLGLVGAGDRRWAPPAACRALLDHMGPAGHEFAECGERTGFSRDFGHTDVIVGRAARAEIWPLIRGWAERWR